MQWFRKVGWEQGWRLWTLDRIAWVSSDRPWRATKERRVMTKGDLPAKIYKWHRGLVSFHKCHWETWFSFTAVLLTYKVRLILTTSSLQMKALKLGYKQASAIWKWTEWVSKRIWKKMRLDTNLKTGLTQLILLFRLFF